MIGTFFSFTIFFYGGFEKILWWLPNSWGTYNDDGDFISHRKYISFMLGFFLAIYVLADFLPKYRRSKIKDK